MKNSFLVLGAVATGLFVASCGGSRSNGASGSDEYAITEFEVNQKLVSADKNYRVDTDYGTVYLDIYTSIQWPEKLGGNNLGVLRDSLLSYAYGDTVSSSILDAVKHFLSDTSIIEGATSVVAVDSLPSDSMTYFNSATASVLDLDEEMVTYRVVCSSYLGGAHPMTTIVPFTYDFNTSKVLNADNIFLPGVSADSIMPVIVEALARQYSVPVGALEREGFFMSNLTYPGRPYIANNILFFHFDPYEIGPYSLGAIDVAVYPYELEAYLRPEIKSLFDNGF